MRDPNRILPIVNALAEVWLENPDLRLGQMILNCTQQGDEAWLYSMEDEELIERIIDVHGGE